MTYSVSRRTGTEVTTAVHVEATDAVRILRRWSAAFPQQYLAIRDDQGTPLAYRRPHSLDSGRFTG